MKAFARLLLVLALVAPTFASAQSQTAPAPTCTLFASAATVAPNTRVRLDWTSRNATAGYLNEVGPIPSAGFAYVVPGKNTTYAASFTGPGGSVVCRTAVIVSAGGGSGGGGSTGTGTTGTGTGVPTTPAPQPNVVVPAAPTGGLTGPTGNGFIGGIVPAECRGKNTVANCDLCSLAQLIQNIANFLLGLSVPAAALLFAWAGIRLFAARGVAEHINAAKKIFKTVLIGFLIIVSVWALVNTVMNMLMKGGELGTWDWRTLDCRAVRGARLYNMSIKDYLNTSLPTLSGYVPTGPILSGGSAFGSECPYGGTMHVTESGNTCVTSGGYNYDAFNPGANSGGCAAGGELTAENFCVRSDGFVYTPGTGSSGSLNSGVGGSGVSGSGGSSGGGGSVCPSGYTYTSEEGGYCENPNNPDDWVEVRTQGRISNPNMAAELQAACAQINGGNCALATKIAMNESSGGRNCTTSNTGAAGCMQVLATTACGMDSSISDSCGACLASRNSIRPQCAPVIQTLENDTQLGTRLGVQYIEQMRTLPALASLRQQYGECQITAAAYFQGAGNVIKAGGVPPNAVSYVNTACR